MSSKYTEIELKKSSRKHFLKTHDAIGDTFCNVDSVLWNDYEQRE